MKENTFQHKLYLKSGYDVFSHCTSKTMLLECIQTKIYKTTYLVTGLNFGIILSFDGR